MEQISKECECGRVHSVNTRNIVVDDNAFESLIDSIKCLNNVKKILIFNSQDDSFYIKELVKIIKFKNIDFEIVNLIGATAQVISVQNIPDKKQDVIIAVGSEELISMAKYYAYMYNSRLIIFPIQNFTDWTFSKFARLYDGVSFDFYLTVEPLEIFVSTKLNDYSQLQSSYISSKYVAIFDDVIKDLVYKTKFCKNAKNYIKRTLSLYNKNKITKENDIWCLIRLGLGMSFYSETKSFFGADKAISDMLQAQVGKVDFLEINVISMKLIINSIVCFFKNYPTKNIVDLNKHIKTLSLLLNISQISTMQRLSRSELILGCESIFSRFRNYFPYLKNVLDNCKKKIYDIQNKLIIDNNFIKKFNLSHKRIQKTFAVASSFYNNPCCLHLLSAFGYLDKLLV